MDVNKAMEELLRDIKARPALYLGKPSLTELGTFLSGYAYGIHQVTNEWGSYLEGFQEWVSDRYKLGTSHSWIRILVFDERDDEVKAFYKFYELIDEFIEERRLKDEREREDS